MTKNMHDVAYELQKAIAENPEFQALKENYAAVQSEPETKQLFEEFRAMQMEFQQKMMQGEALAEEDNVRAQSMLEKIQQNEKITALMQGEQRLNLLIGDLNKIIMKPLEELYSTYMQS
ncbi:YlbF family regulator [Bacillus manliponensis]|uniref:UPF0342 protein BAMA_24275 n=1 Tax=Bacillus manliponensis TaxID=574376 RepID=A0A073JXW2_9BACI|nr:YlbF family regulator [Bacillus manliponensis]KEK19131.1 hypothetical protein BAMA_24275 [Bacillus manliponensis]